MMQVHHVDSNIIELMHRKIRSITDSDMCRTGRRGLVSKCSKVPLVRRPGKNGITLHTSSDPESEIPYASVHT